MGLLSPWFLVGLAAAGLPVWLHLLRRHRSEPLRFSSLMFFEPRTQSSIKHRRLEYLLLLSLRLALLLLLVLAFANPFLTSKGAIATSGRKLALYVIDNSLSMRESNAIGRAKQQALAAIAELPQGSQGQVIALGSQVQLLTQATQDRDQLRAAVAALQPGDSAGSYGELVRAVRSIAQAVRMPVEVHLFSDMQRTSLPAAFSDLRLPAGTVLVPHATADSRRPNWAVERVTAPRRVTDVKKARVQATVAGYGTGAARREVSLVVNNRGVATRSVDIPASGRATVEFLSLDVPYGLNRCEVRISPADNLPDDDRFYFAVERADPKRVLFVHEARQPRGLLYFRTALESGAEAGFAIDAATADQVGNIVPGKYAAVVLSDVAALPANFEEALKKYVRDGGAVLVAMGPVSATRARVPVFDEAVVESRYTPRSGERFQSAGTFDPEHPVLRRAGGWQSVKFYQVVRVQPGNARVVARLADDTPLILEKKLGEGRVLLFASTFDNISNDFPLHASFVPFTEQTINYLSGEEGRPSAVPVDSYVELRSAKDQGTAVEVSDPDGRRLLSLQEAATAQNFRVTRAGHYEIRRGNGRNELIAANTDRRESDLDLIPKETLALWKDTGSPAAGAGGPAEEAERSRRPLWPYLLAAALAAALVESFVASRYMKAPAARSKLKEEAQSAPVGHL